MTEPNALHATHDADSFRRSQSWLVRSYVLALLLWCAIPFSPNTVDSDFWGHVQYGRDAIAHGLPATATYTYTAEGYRWINHENLSEMIFAMGADSVGTCGLLVMKCLMGLVVIGLIVRHARCQGAGWFTVSLVAVLVSVNLSYYWSMRPQIFSFTCFALLIALLNWCFAGANPATSFLPGSGDVKIPNGVARLGFLWLAVPLFFFWANSHGGFAAGYCVFVALLACRGLEWLSARGWSSTELIGRLVLMVVVAGLATLINPYGPRLHGWLIESLSVPRPEIREWHAPDLWSWSSLKLWALIGSGLAATLFSRKSRDFTHFVLLALTLWQALSHQRHVPFLAILFGFWLPVHIESVVARLRGGLPTGPILHPAPIGLCRLGTLAASIAATLLAFQVGQRLAGMSVDKGRFPVSAFQYMADQDLNGKLLVTGKWGQYAIATLGARTPEADGVRVAFDGRFRTCYPQEVVDMHFDFTVGAGSPECRHRSDNSPPVDATRALHFRRPDLVLIDRGQDQSVAVMTQQRADWALLYQDALAQLWGRKEIFDQTGEDRHVPPAQRNITDKPQIGHVAWPAAPRLDRSISRQPIVRLRSTRDKLGGTTARKQSMGRNAT